MFLRVRVTATRQLTQGSYIFEAMKRGRGCHFAFNFVPLLENDATLLLIDIFNFWFGDGVVILKNNAKNEHTSHFVFSKSSLNPLHLPNFLHYHTFSIPSVRYIDWCPCSSKEAASLYYSYTSALIKMQLCLHPNLMPVFLV